MHYRNMCRPPYDEDYIKECVEDFTDFQTSLRDAGYCYDSQMAATLYVVMKRGK